MSSLDPTSRAQRGAGHRRVMPHRTLHVPNTRRDRRVDRGGGRPAGCQNFLPFPRTVRVVSSFKRGFGLCARVLGSRRDEAVRLDRRQQERLVHVQPCGPRRVDAVVVQQRGALWT